MSKSHFPDRSSLHLKRWFACWNPETHLLSSAGGQTHWHNPVLLPSSVARQASTSKRRRTERICTTVRNWVKPEVTIKREPLPVLSQAERNQAESWYQSSDLEGSCQGMSTTAAGLKLQQTLRLLIKPLSHQPKWHLMNLRSLGVLSWSDCYVNVASVEWWE